MLQRHSKAQTVLCKLKKLQLVQTERTIFSAMKGRDCATVTGVWKFPWGCTMSVLNQRDLNDINGFVLPPFVGTPATSKAVTTARQWSVADTRPTSKGPPLILRHVSHVPLPLVSEENKKHTKNYSFCLCVCGFNSSATVCYLPSAWIFMHREFT